MTIDEIKKFPEFQEILNRAEYIKSFGSIFNFRLNRFQPKNKIIKIVKRCLTDEDVENQIKLLYTHADVFRYLNKGKETNNDPLEIAIYSIPSTYTPHTNRFSYDLFYIDAGTEKNVYKLDIPSRNKSFWIDSDDNIFTKFNNSETFVKRKLQVNSAGNKTLSIDGKTLSLKTIKERTTDIVDIMYNEDN